MKLPDHFLWHRGFAFNQQAMYISSLSKFSVFICAILLFILSGFAHASDRLFDVTSSAASSSTSAAQVMPDVSVTLNKQVSAGLVAGNSVEVVIPASGKVVVGKVLPSVKGAQKAGDPSETSRTVVTFANNAGSLTLINRNNAFSEMLLYDNSTRLMYKAVLDTTGSGVFKKEDLNKYQCVSFPMPKASSLSEALKPDALTPDLATLQNLQSKPTATKVLYIDYWGGTISGTAWNANYNSGNPITYTPYSYDADKTAFSDTDRYLMWLGFQEAAEDYSAFGINVTTKKSVYDATPIANRSRIIATTTNYFYTGAGGVAYVGIFNNTSDYYKTGWAWNSGAGSLGMTISHEAGHQMGLGHDGTSSLGYYGGHGVWGPIMGAPFNKPYVQWSKGEYPSANNSQNDFTIIGSVLGTTVDDAGNTVATATALTLPTTNQERRIHPDGLAADVDVYKFTLASAGVATVKVQPVLGAENEARAANLAMSVKLANSAGTVIHQVNSNAVSPLAPTTNKFEYSGTLAAGTYYLTVDAVSPNTSWTTGFGEYGNEGRYRLNVAVAAAPTPKLTSPTPSTKLASSSQVFSWIANGASVNNYHLYVGSTQGAYDIHNSGELANTVTSRSVTGLPTTGVPLYVRFWWKQGTVWQYIDYSYTAAGSSSPQIVTPSSGATFTNTSQTFTWRNNSTANVLKYALYVGSSVGGSNIHNSGILSNASTSRTVTGLPNNGSKLYVRFWYYIGGAHPAPQANAKLQANVAAGTWYYRDYTYNSVTLAGFDEQFNGSIAKWLARSGVWTNASSAYLYTPGRAASWNFVTYSPSTYSNVDYSVKLWRYGSSTNSSNIVIRSSGAVSSNGGCSDCYIFQYTRSGSYSIWKRVNGTETALQNWATSTAIATNDNWNTLRVRAVGSSLQFYINGTLVKSVTDTSHTSGYVGMSMYSPTTGTTETLYADWATLSVPSATLMDSVQYEAVSSEQQRLNAAANANPRNYDPSRSTPSQK